MLIILEAFSQIFQGSFFRLEASSSRKNPTTTTVPIASTIVPSAGQNERLASPDLIDQTKRTNQDKIVR